MFAILAFVARLVTDVGRFVGVFTNDLLLGAGDPLAVVSLLVGLVFFAVSGLVFGYAALGALLNEIGVKLPSLGGRGRTS